MSSGPVESESSVPIPPPEKAKKGFPSLLWEKILGNAATSIAVAVIGLVGVVAALLWATIKVQVANELDNQIAAAVENKKSLTRTALANMLAEEMASTDAHKVGALSIGTVILERGHSEQTVYLYLPAKYRSQIWLGIQYTNMVAPNPKGPSILSVALNGRKGPDIPNAATEHGFDLSEAIMKAQAIERGDIRNTATNAIVSLPALSRLTALHQITFVANPSAFTAPDQSIFIKYVAVVQPAIRLN